MLVRTLCFKMFVVSVHFLYLCDNIRNSIHPTMYQVSYKLSFVNDCTLIMPQTSNKFTKNIKFCDFLCSWKGECVCGIYHKNQPTDRYDRYQAELNSPKFPPPRIRILNEFFSIEVEFGLAAIILAPTISSFPPEIWTDSETPAAVRKSPPVRTQTWPKNCLWSKLTTQ